MEDKNEKKEYWDEVYRSGKEFAQILPDVLDLVLGEYTDRAAEIRCLDIGCGEGKLLKTLSDRGVVCDGVDVSSEALQKAEMLGLAGRLYQLDIENAEEFVKERRGSYNIIFVTLVLAFIEDKIRFYGMCKEMLATNGVLFIYTPIWNTEKASSRPGISIDEDQFLADAKESGFVVEIAGEFQREYGLVKTYILKSSA